MLFNGQKLFKGKKAFDKSSKNLILILTFYGHIINNMYTLFLYSTYNWYKKQLAKNVNSLQALNCSEPGNSRCSRKTGLVSNAIFCALQYLTSLGALVVSWFVHSLSYLVQKLVTRSTFPMFYFDTESLGGGTTRRATNMLL